MEKDRERTYNGSYLYRLNEELSGQAELDPYFVDVETDDESLDDRVSGLGGDPSETGEEENEPKM